MYGQIKNHLQTELSDVESAGLFKKERIITTPQGADVSVSSGEEVVIMCANNYLGLSSHPDVVQASKNALDTHGFGMSSVRFICGTQDIHKQLEQKIASFYGTEDTILYAAAFDANGGLFEPLFSKEDAIISDELNHASIIDGVRLCKAHRYRYKHSDMADLEKQLIEAQNQRFRIIVTDGVFSMDGDIAPLDEITKLAREYGAMTYIDDCHGEGVLAGGRGIGAHFGVEDEVDMESGSFSKAFGVVGGLVAGEKHMVDYAFNKSRTMLLSGSAPPATIAACKASIEVLETEPEHVEKLWSNTEYFRKEVQSMGFDTGVSETPIIPVMCGESHKAKELSAELLKMDVFALPIVFPMVAPDKARIRVMMSAGLEKEDLDHALNAFEKGGKSAGII